MRREEFMHRIEEAAEDLESANQAPEDRALWLSEAIDALTKVRDRQSELARREASR